MKMTPYTRQMEIETRTICSQSVRRLEEEIRMANEAHNRRISALEARLKSCKETISRIDKEFAAE